jgi:hypothetical protein
MHVVDYYLAVAADIFVLILLLLLLAIILPLFPGRRPLGESAILPRRYRRLDYIVTVATTVAAYAIVVVTSASFSTGHLPLLLTLPPSAATYLWAVALIGAIAQQIIVTLGQRKRRSTDVNGNREQRW